MTKQKHTDIQKQIARALGVDISDSRINDIESAFNQAKNIQDTVEKCNSKDPFEIKKDLKELIDNFEKIKKKLKHTDIIEKHLYDQYCFLANPYSDLNLIKKNRSINIESGFESVVAELSSGLNRYQELLKGGKPKDFTHTDAMIVLIEAIHLNFPDINLSPAESSNLTKVISAYYGNLFDDHTSLKDRIKKGIAAYKKSQG
jgi:hypothetical protein